MTDKITNIKKNGELVREIEWMWYRDKGDNKETKILRANENYLLNTFIDDDDEDNNDCYDEWHQGW